MLKSILILHILIYCSADFPNVYKLPMFPLWLQHLLDTHSPLCKEAKCQRAITDALFEDLLQYG